MKLRRLISALVVFTLVMTCALSVVSVEADETSVPTYHATTTYNPATDEITVHAEITGATPGSVVTFTIDGDSNVHTAEGTVGEDGTLVFADCTKKYSAVENCTINFESDTDELTRYINDQTAYATSVCQSVNKITRFNKSILFVTKQYFGGKYNISYVKDGVVYESEQLSSGVTNTAWGAADNKGRALYDDPDAAGDDDSCIFVLPLDADYWMIDFRGANGRSITNTISIFEYKGSFNGKLYSNTAGDTIFDNSGATIVNNLVGNRYKEVVSDGEFAGIDLEGGRILALDVTNSEDDTTGTTAYHMLKILSDPIVGTYTDANGKEWDSLTFLYNVSRAHKLGIRIYRYPKGTVNYDTDGGTAGAVGELVETSANNQDVFGYTNNLVSNKVQAGNYGVQLVGDLDLDLYDYEAVPCYYKGTNFTTTQNWTEITPFGSDDIRYNGKALFYINERDAYEEVAEN